MHFSDANLRVYGSSAGVPAAVVQTAAAAESEAEAAELQTLLAGDRQGYASTRVGSAEAAAAASGMTSHDASGEDAAATLVIAAHSPQVGTGCLSWCEEYS